MIAFHSKCTKINHKRIEIIKIHSKKITECYFDLVQKSNLKFSKILAKFNQNLQLSESKQVVWCGKGLVIESLKKWQKPGLTYVGAGKGMTLTIHPVLGWIWASISKVGPRLICFCSVRPDHEPAWFGPMVSFLFNPDLIATDRAVGHPHMRTIYGNPICTFLSLFFKDAEEEGRGHFHMKCLVIWIGQCFPTIKLHI